jgi:hypothetical protein
MSCVADVNIATRINDRFFSKTPFLNRESTSILVPLNVDESDPTLVEAVKAGKLVLLDSALNHQAAVEKTYHLRQKYPEINIAGGRVNTPYAAMRMMQAGANFLWIDNINYVQELLALRQAVNSFGSNVKIVMSEPGPVDSTFEQEHIALSCGVDFYLVAENEIQTLSNNLREQMFRVGIDSMTALQQAQLTTGM